MHRSTRPPLEAYEVKGNYRRDPSGTATGHKGLPKILATDLYLL